jgi:murein L,D-transpeptidase YafK
MRVHVPRRWVRAGSITLVQAALALGLTGCSFFEWLFGISDDPKPQTSQVEEVQIPLRVALMASGHKKGDPVYIRIYKEDGELEVWMQNSVERRWSRVRTYPICYFSGDLGPKLKEGDKQSPEGFYEVRREQLNPNSSYHLSFNLGYPNEFDRANGRTGNYLMVHGGCGSRGCYAMTNPGIEEIYGLTEAALLAGQPYVPVHAFPARLSDDWLAQKRDSEWIAFWQDLKTCDDHFTLTGSPARPSVEGGRYRCQPVDMSTAGMSVPQAETLASALENSDTSAD